MSCNSHRAQGTPTRSCCKLRVAFLFMKLRKGTTIGRCMRELARTAQPLDDDTRAVAMGARWAREDGPYSAVWSLYVGGWTAWSVDWCSNKDAGKPRTEATNLYMSSHLLSLSSLSVSSRPLSSLFSPLASLLLPFFPSPVFLPCCLSLPAVGCLVFFSSFFCPLELSVRTQASGNGFLAANFEVCALAACSDLPSAPRRQRPPKSPHFPGMAGGERALAGGDELGRDVAASCSLPPRIVRSSSRVPFLCSASSSKLFSAQCATTSVRKPTQRVKELGHERQAGDVRETLRGVHPLKREQTVETKSENRATRVPAQGKLVLATLSVPRHGRSCQMTG